MFFWCRIMRDSPALSSAHSGEKAVRFIVASHGVVRNLRLTMKSHSIALTLLSLSTAGALAWAYTLQQRLSDAEARLAVVKNSAPRTTEPLSVASEEKRSPTTAQTASATMAEAKTEKPAAEASAAKKKDSPLKGLMKMMSDPSMREMMKSQYAMQIDFTYSDLFDELNLSKEDREKFKNLLIDRQADIASSAEFFINNDLSPEEKAAQQKIFDEKNKTAEAAVKAFFKTPEDYDKFQRYEDSQQERLSLSQFRGALTQQGMSLSEQQESDLMAAMYKERKSFKFDVDFANQKPENLAHMTPENIQSFAEKSTQLMDNQVLAAEKILDEKQMGAYRTHIDSQKKMQEMGMQMFKAMMQTGEEKK
jgi:hypothetical protein